MCLSVCLSAKPLLECCASEVSLSISQASFRRMNSGPFSSQTPDLQGSVLLGAVVAVGLAC